jgi:prepilin-type N-terminal cleavage/methylation domain-containing protein
MNALAKKRGFTLVELIVVIAIVAILAAVSIVGYQGYIDKARRSNDVTDAKNMTNILQAYMLQHNLSDVDPSEIRAIVNIDNDYTFIPRADGYSFWYEEESRIITIKSTYEAMSEGGDFTELTGHRATMLLSDGLAHLGANDPDPGEQLEELVDGWYLLDRGGSDVADAIFMVRNLKTDDDFAAAVATLTESGFTKLAGHIETDFALEDTLFINDFFGFTASLNDDLSPNHEVDNVVFADQIETIPSSALNIVRDLPGTLRLPASVTMIERDAFVVTYEDDVTGAIVTEPVNATITYDDIAKIRVEDYAFHESDAANTSLKAKAGSAELLELDFELEFTNPTTYFYSAANAYLGKRVMTKSTSEVSQESFVKVVPSPNWDGTTCSVPDNYDTTYADYDGYYCSDGVDDMYVFVMRNGAEFEVPFDNSATTGQYGTDVAGTVYLLVMEYDYTYTYYLGNEMVGTKTVDGLTVTYYADEMNWSWGAWKPSQYDYYLWTFTSGTYSGSPFALSYAVEFDNDSATASYANGFADEADYVTKAGVLYADTNYQVNFVDQRVKVYLSGSTVTLYGAHIVYRDASGLTIVEAKGYDEDGKLIAKGVLRFVKTYDSIPVVKPSEFS